MKGACLTVFSDPWGGVNVGECSGWALWRFVLRPLTPSAAVVFQQSRPSPDGGGNR